MSLNCYKSLHYIIFCFSSLSVNKLIINLNVPINVKYFVFSLNGVFPVQTKEKKGVLLYSK